MIQIRGSWPKAACAIDRDLGESFVLDLSTNHGPDQRGEDEGQRAACAPRQPDFFLRKSSSLLGGLARVDWMFTLANTAYHLVRLSAD